MTAPNARAVRYVALLARRTTLVLAGGVAALGLAIYLVTFHLPLFADFAYLLPKDAQSVVDLHKLEARLAGNDTVLVVVDAPDRATCASATTELAAAIRRIRPTLVVRVDEDQADARAYLWEHRFVLAPLAEVKRAHDALRERIDAAKLAANPLFVDLDDKPDAAVTDAAAKQQISDLRKRRREIEELLHRPTNVSPDGKRALIEVRAAMSATDIEQGEQLLGELDAARTTVTERHAGLAIGFAGDLVTAIAEHDAIVSGTLVSSAVTALLVGLVLVLYFRSIRLLAILVATITLATIAAFATAVFSIGHLNAATAFLGAIIAGNGVNYGILLIARLLEERRANDLQPALAIAIATTMRPTLIASLGAAIAYGALAATSFKGFADFAIIGSAGMILCWLATYTVLPALVLRFARDVRARSEERPLERALVRVLGLRRPRLVVAVAIAVGIGAGAVVAHYLAGDPFEYDLRELGSVADASETERMWMKLAESSFGKGRAGRTFIAADTDTQVSAIVTALERPDLRGVVGSVQSILDVVPDQRDQETKLALLTEIRAMLDDPRLEEALTERELAELRELRPPETIGRVTRAMLPPSIIELLAEKSGRIGALVSVRPDEHLDELDGHDVIRFADAVRSLDLGDGQVVTTSGASVIFADILEVIAHDGPIVTAIALFGIALLLLVLVGFNRRGLAVFVGTTGGALLMVAVCALLDLKINFLDFVALPITLGLGVDYGINVAHRQLAVRDPIVMLRTSGAAVFVCSLTTMIGYGSLLVSDNLAIRGFGRASLIGEVTTVLAALVLVPAILAFGSYPPPSSPAR